MENGKSIKEIPDYIKNFVKSVEFQNRRCLKKEWCHCEIYTSHLSVEQTNNTIKYFESTGWNVIKIDLETTYIPRKRQLFPKEQRKEFGTNKLLLSKKNNHINQKISRIEAVPKI